MTYASPSWATRFDVRAIATARSQPIRLRQSLQYPNYDTVYPFPDFVTHYRVAFGTL
jgi:hypothetical protein